MTLVENKLYRCENPACSLGAVGAPGHFTGGITYDQAYMLTGNPESVYGEGVCPNCGKTSVDTGEMSVWSAGHDPLTKAVLIEEVKKIKSEENN